jgi:hypothetical protein
VAGLAVALTLLGVGAVGVVGALVGLDGDAAVQVGTAPPTASSPPPVPSGAPEAVPAVPVVPATPPPVADGASPTAPVRVAVAAHGIDVAVDPVGVAADGQMEIPPLAERGGWYRFGADPGDPAGTTVVAAHVDSVASGGTGPFVRLVEVRPGDAVEVTLADGSTRAYAVDRVEQLPKSQARWPDVFTRDGPPRLALVTCGGTFDAGTRHYRDNVLVIAAPVGA